jgi:hypothetical protein
MSDLATKSIQKKDLPKINISCVNEEAKRKNSNNSFSKIDNRLHLEVGNQSNNIIVNKKKKKKIENPFKLFRRAIPIMPKPLAILCCIGNIFLPGSGKTFFNVDIHF